MKYIETDKNFYVFPMHINHADFKSIIIKDEELVSAGMAFANHHNKKLKTFGESTSLNIKASNTPIELPTLYCHKLNSDTLYLSFNKKNDDFVMVNLILDYDKNSFSTNGIDNFGIEIVENELNNDKLINFINNLS